MKKVIIVGAVGGGATAASQLRYYDKDMAITVYDRDSTMSYAACGTPYVIGGVIEEESSIIMANPDQFKNKRNIDVLLAHEIVEIDRIQKQVLVRNLSTGDEFSDSYDALILSPGGSAIMPEIAGLDKGNVFTLRSYADMQAIQTFIDREKPSHCVVSGAGFIGLEMAENLCHLGLEVTIVHKSSAILSILDEDLSKLLHSELERHNIDVHTDAVIEKIDKKEAHLSNGKRLASDLVIMSIGFKPNTALAEQACLSIGETGGIRTNEFMQTDDPAIYAIGDATENSDFITGDPKRVPLAVPAHRQAFLAARHITGSPIAKKGLLGTSILKVFDLDAAMTGLTETQINEKGLLAKTVTHTGNSNAGYYPDHSKLTLKVHYNPETRQILGAQCVGGKGVDKRIDVIATAIYGGLTIDDLQALELCYAPPFSSPKDPVNMISYKAIE
ncbi:CoA-disulfide reductase [Planococcus sp. ISL-109]|uniref:CoA-disulfide reductase n=1 Tax=Planococcus sp. ISL-109 TaxID=2819166 RepID=UPI001BEBA889|nr:CoA-disulfide reductase [Planococcus sp. ISL-109]MBT2581713.1 CoA-disulfide reductase [Planococcus sp. ISL-109]